MTIQDIIFVTGSEKTSLIYTKYTCSYYGTCTYLMFWMCHSQSVCFIKFPIEFSMLDKSCVIIQSSYYQKLLQFERSELGQILSVDKTCFLRPGHICSSWFLDIVISTCLL